ncbi:MAG TPA: tryptophan synthase subunit alpha [Hungateiclostridium thermocellum]|jgi:tryptophan synthase alpha chain|uniref:Tryptophan synthase alpha chain n=2 Tax=Acetivibrio thermocellus TaxID=1515 RepID=A3DFB3_ACET2|nr:tryptophan synthase subunit alpha [Acetivibrio thermocellus]CDG36088.1 Tryptophan synthase alpha chain [Acetivibrio thermocellus BC1]ABN52642.1 tryptophan synthase, alpha subunit [Acetivibrio thermocellus ATCC 27405]ADU73906.1 tryptophan synthase, alpha subunit [Acetivibrio thermocellus DSM 1313]ALX07845.1 Tryptophan synthase alpha chain [Acetivibrio thermocellus AD2]ANV75590.1 Tryptophan synthase alpha chain [Acetivibrio thermocellus DSM 2360]
MNKLERAFSNGKAFIPFITAGDPSLEITEQLVYRMAEAGADLIELGIPFSDPVAEGPVIQEADYRALSAGTTTDKIFDMVGRIRKSCDIPIAFMTYANPIFTYGSEKFLKRCGETGIDALIVPDIPFEEKEELAPFCKEYDVRFISMIAPTSKERIRMIAREAEGFIYCVSSMGVTGVREKIGDDAKEMIKIVKEVRDIPCAVGFGISTPEQAAQMAGFSDGVIVGSAIVKIIAQYGAECIPYVEEYVRKMKNAIK